MLVIIVLGPSAYISTFFKANWDIWSLYVSDNVVDLREHTYKNELFLILKVHLVYWEGCIYKLITIR